MSGSSVASNSAGLSRCSRGAALIEFAFALPLLLILSLPLINYLNYILTIQKVEKSAAVIGDMLSISVPPTTATTLADANADPLIFSRISVRTMMESAHNLMIPYTFTAANEARISVYGIDRSTAAAPSMVWRADYFGSDISYTAENYSPARAVPAVVDTTFTNNMFVGEMAIVVEVNYRFDPPMDVFPDLGVPALSPTLIREVRYFPSRNGPMPFMFMN